MSGVVHREPLPAPASPQAPRFLLFARPEPEGTGGPGALVGTFANEQDARDVFRELRLSSVYRDGWAELIRQHGQAEPSRLCWFGAEFSSRWLSLSVCWSMSGIPLS